MRSRWLGLVPYAEAEALQRAIHEHADADYLLLQEHPHVYTLGSSAKVEHVLRDPATVGAQLVEADRGGDVTYHGPGQLVGYPIINVRDFKLGVKSYVYLLEEALIGVLEEFGIIGERIKDHTGVWIGREKIAAIGVCVKNGITMHGFALNVNTDLNYFSFIIPCGISNMGVTSMKKILNERIPLEEVAVAFAEKFGKWFQTDMSLALDSTEIAEFSRNLSLCSL